MNQPNNQHDTVIDEQLVAYLDGELSVDDARRLDARLAEDAKLLEKVKQHQRAWDLLDELPRTGVADGFTQSTVEMVAVCVADDAVRASRRGRVHKRFSWLIGGSIVAAASLAGYALVASLAAAPDRQLVKDLRVIENLDEYRAVEDIEFLRALEREGLFAAEVDDEL